MTNLIPTATIILAEISVVLLILLSVLGFRYLRRSRQHRREIETLMEMARDSRVVLPGSKAAAAAAARPAAGKAARPARTQDTGGGADAAGATMRPADSAHTGDEVPGAPAESAEVRPEASAPLLDGGTGADEGAPDAGVQVDSSDGAIEPPAGAGVSASAGRDAPVEPARGIPTPTDSTGVATDTAAAAATAVTPVSDPASLSDPAPADPAPAPPAPAATDGGSAERPIAVPGVHEILILRRTVANLEGRMLQAHREHLQLAGRMRRGMDRVTEDVAAMRRDIARLVEKLSDDRTAAPPRAGGRQPADAIDGQAFATRGAGPGAVPAEGGSERIRDQSRDRSGDPIGGRAGEPGGGPVRDPTGGPGTGSGEEPVGHPFETAAVSGPDPANAVDHAMHDATPRGEAPPPTHDAGVPGDPVGGGYGSVAGPRGDVSPHEPPPGDGTSGPVDPYWLHDPMETVEEDPTARAATTAGAGAPADEDPDYLLDDETIQRLLGSEAVAASPPGGGIDVEEISLSDFGPQHTPAPTPTPQPFASRQDDIFFQSSTTDGLEQGWYITLAGEPPQGPFSDKQTAERVLNEVRGHAAGRSAQGG